MATNPVANERGYGPLDLAETGIINPMFRLDLIIDAYPCLFFCWIRRLFKGRFK